MSLEELTSRQQETGSEIKRVCVNYKKDSPDRKTLEYLNNRFKTLEALWTDFEDTDNKIRTAYGSQLNHPYFTKEYYTGIKVGYEEIKGDVLKRIETLKNQLKTPEERGVQGAEATADSGKSPYNPQPKDGKASLEDTKSTSDRIPSTSQLRGDSPKPTARLTIPTQDTAINNIGGSVRKQRSLIQSLERALSSLPRNIQQSVQFYQVKIKAIEQYWYQIEDLHHKMWEETNNPVAFGYNSEEYFQLEESVQSKLIQLYEAMNQVVSDSTRQTIQPESTPITSMMKLPNITLPKFDGEYLKWRQFRDLFTELVHNQPIAECQKIWYLKTSLSGEAERLIRHLTMSDANYAIAWRILNERYENPRLLVTAVLNKLLGQPTIGSESPTAIKTMHDTTQECLLALENLEIATTNWDPIVLHILIKKLDKTTHILWEQSQKQPRMLQSIKDFLQFLENRFQSLEALGTKAKSSDDQHRKQHPYKTASSLVMLGSSCASCKGQHQLFACQRFLKMSPSNRLSFVRSSRLCVNCLRPGHNGRNCQSRGCSKCSRRHNTLLHLEGSTTNNIVTPPEGRTIIKNTIGSDDTSSGSSNVSTNQPNTKSASLTANTSQSNKGYVLLSTVMVKLTHDNGHNIECRAILDSGSQLNIVTDRIAKQLGLEGTDEQMSIEGIGQRNQKSQRRVEFTLESRVNGFSTRMKAYVLPRIISPQPTQAIDIASWSIPSNIALADPHFNKRGEIDLLIGAEIYYSILAIGQIKLSDTLPTLQNTMFGWTVSGKIHDIAPNNSICGICTEDERLSEQVERFWRLEDIEGPNSTFTSAERQCENHFYQNYKRDVSGRFIVKLPIQGDPQGLGESKDMAYRRFLRMERNFSKNEQLMEQYSKFMDEYQQLGHMKEVNFDQIKGPYYFMPHHAVIKPESSTTKLRVVFDASAKTTSGISLNDILHVGPMIQDDVFSILLRFRIPRYVFTADIEKMYRQIQVESDDQRFQLIWWRGKPSENIRCFQLSTVTYGTACAPYLAIKCLQRLAEEEAEKYPLALQIIKKNFYVDDVLTGSNSLVEATLMQSQLQSLLRQGGFRLRKWCANHPQLLQGIPHDDRELKLDFSNGIEEHIKTMGLIWSPKTDMFRIRFNKPEQNRITKRTVVSDIAHLFDPLGIMGPVVVVAKLFAQKLWALKIDWDAALPQEQHTYWANFKENLGLLNNITFPRHVFSHRSPDIVQIHVFTDASERAFGAAAYVRSINKDNVITVRLLCAKSKVAPLKQHTLPRLELCAAKLGAELANRIKTDLNLKREAIFFWTDSEVTLAWINSRSSTFQTFVANRVSTIQRLTSPDQWRHVNSKHNAADVLSRGTTPEKLTSDNLWFFGPLFLHGVESCWPPVYAKKGDCTLEARKSTSAAASCSSRTHFVELINHKNSFKKLQRIVAYILRFIKNAQKQKTYSEQLAAEELQNARNAILKTMQEREFEDDLTHLKRYGEVPKNSSIASLTPFIDHEGVMRVGGRLEAADLSYDSKHPILLPYAHPLTKVILTEIHLENRHIGPQNLLAMSRQNYWPIKGKTLVRSVVQHCVHCARAKPKVLNQLMGNLPPARVQPARPFANAGVDFCGPVWTHFKVRGKRPQKAYIAVFCCFSTKAVHLEMVSDLSTEGFIGALKRFTARRGHCRHIYCDNGTNFVGAKNQLQEVRETLESQRAIDKITATCSSKGTDFHLIPPRSPHFGGLWEAAVKSAKHLLQSTLIAASLTYEEMETVVIEVEAILNSRPITPMSADPNDLMALTPGHFLVGEPLTSSVDSHAEPLNVNLLTRWKLVTYLKNEFWRRWHKEYLNQLQYRVKWKQRAQNIKLGTMVVIKEDNTPALRWKLGRIVQTYPGEDGLVRVADVRTATGMLRRPIHKLAPLPIEGSEADHDKGSTTEPESQNCARSEIHTVTRDTTAVPGPSYSQRRGLHDNTHAEESCPKRKKRSLGSTLVTLLITCLLLPIARSAPVETIPFDNQPGIYFENLGPSSIISSEWNLVAYYNLEPFWTEFQSLKNYHQKLEEVCKLMHERSACLQIFNQFQHLIEELSQNNELLSNKPNNRRQRRGAINFIGNMANALFGVLDSEYAEKMSNTIDKIEQNELHLSELLKNQTSLMDATINVMRKDQQAISQQFHQLEDHINRVTAGINGIQQELYQEQLSQLFTSLAIQTMLLASNFYRIQNAILDVMVDTHQGRISPQLIPPAQLLQEINTVKRHIPTSLRLPAITDDILRFYNLMNVKGRAEGKRIIFKITLPLLASENLELFHIVPVPVKINETFIAIQPSFPYLLLNLHRDQYYPMTEHELTSCTSLNKDGYLCKQMHPMYRKGSAVSACEINFINQAQQSSSCRIAKVEEGPHWIQLHAANHWIYSLDKKTTINVVCGDNVTQFTIERAGRLKMQADCIIKQPLLTIQGHNLFPSITRLSYIPSTNLTENLTINQTVSALRQTHHYVPHLEELAEIKKKLLDMHSELPAKLNHHDAHQYTVSYISLLLIIITLAYITWNYRGKICSTSEKNTDSEDPAELSPAPTSHDEHQSSPDNFVVSFD